MDCIRVLPEKRGALEKARRDKPVNDMTFAG
jgi:hypothetical protein